MPHAEPNSRWFQFSLRLLLLVVVAGNVFWWAYAAYVREQEAASVYRELAHQKDQMIQAKERLITTILLFEQVDKSYPNTNVGNFTVERMSKISRAFFVQIGVYVQEANTESAALKARLKECGCADE